MEDCRPRRGPPSGPLPPEAPFIGFTDGFPDSTRGDVVYFFQRSATTVGSGATAAVASAATRFTRLTDSTLSPGVTTLSVALTDTAPQTGTVHADVRYSQFAALAPAIHPTAVPSDPSSLGFSVMATPRSLQFPDMPPALFENTARSRSRAPPSSRAMSITGRFIMASSSIPPGKPTASPSSPSTPVFHSLEAPLAWRNHPSYRESRCRPTPARLRPRSALRPTPRSRVATRS